MKKMKTDNSMIIKLLIVVISLLLVLTATFFWNSNKSGHEAINELKETIVDATPVDSSTRDSTNTFIKAPISSIPKLNNQGLNASKIVSESSGENPQIPILSIISQKAGETSIGGKFWIVTVKNDSKQPIIRPRVVMSLFDKENRRIGEHTGWSKIETLAVDAEATILVLVSEPPVVEFTTKIQAIASFPTQFASQIYEVEVQDYIINTDNKNPKKAVIVGDVINQQKFRLDYIRVQAIALNEKGMAVGLADAFATNASLSENKKSGFQIKVNTFIIEPATSWKLVAFGRKSRAK
ncbi:MAG: hypothetical protein AB8B80_03855 [Marinicellaceae bacterium]